MATQEWFLGIDPSAASTGVTVISNNGDKVVKAIATGQLRGAERLLFISSSLQAILIDKKISCCFIESPAYDAVHKEFILGEVLGCIKLTLIQNGITNILDATPTQVKKFMAGSGRASKDQVSAAAVLDGCPSPQNDITDSWSLARIAQSVHEGRSCINKRHSVEVIHSILTKAKKL
jgi:Holliday junction resolvasome RuvABC endonuclease subunit